jgi:hypothetical protein
MENCDILTIQAITTIILVLITGFYACITYKMEKVMSKQTVADIQVSNIIIGSTFAEKWFRDRLIEKPEEFCNVSYIKFVLLFDVRNKGLGNGSIDKPKLILKFTNDNFEQKVDPVIEETLKQNETTDGSFTTWTTTVEDLGGTIFLRGGDSKKVKIEYDFYDIEMDKKLSTHIKEKLDFLEYYIRYTDNLGKTSLIKIENIEEEEKIRKKGRR